MRSPIRLCPARCRLLSSPETSEIYNNLKSSGHIIYYGGHLTTAEMAKLHQASDCYVSPYAYEGFNMPVLEALATGSRVVVTEGGSTEDFVTLTEEGVWKVKSEVNTFKGVQKAMPGQSNAFQVEGYGETEKFVDVIAKELVVDSEDLISKMAEAIVSRENGRMERASVAKEMYTWSKVTEMVVEEGLKLRK